MQIEARINQDQNISKDLTLWNQQGSQVLRGQMLVLPVEDTFLYVEPHLHPGGGGAHAAAEESGAGDGQFADLSRHLRGGPGRTGRADARRRSRSQAGGRIAGAGGRRAGASISSQRLESISGSTCSAIASSPARAAGRKPERSCRPLNPNSSGGSPARTRAD